jgi:hypothetical protein
MLLLNIWFTIVFQMYNSNIWNTIVNQMFNSNIRNTIVKLFQIVFQMLLLILKDVQTIHRSRRSTVTFEILFERALQ